MRDNRLQYGGARQEQYMKSVTFRLDESDVDLLKLVAAKRDESQADAIRFCIRSAADATREQDASGAQGEAMTELVALLRDQLAAKDGQISRLQDALDAAQETAKAAQILHAQERAALESAEQKAERRWRWPWQRG